MRWPQLPLRPHHLTQQAEAVSGPGNLPEQPVSESPITVPLQKQAKRGMTQIRLSDRGILSCFPLISCARRQEISLFPVGIASAPAADRVPVHNREPAENESRNLRIPCFSGSGFSLRHSASENQPVLFRSARNIRFLCYCLIKSSIRPAGLRHPGCFGLPVEETLLKEHNPFVFRKPARFHVKSAQYCRCIPFRSTQAGQFRKGGSRSHL